MRIKVSVLVLFLSLTAWQGAATGSEVETVALTVVQKDTLSNICKKYLDNPEHWRRVARINHLANPNLILPGQVVKMPADLLKGTPVQGVVTFVKGDAALQESESGAWRPVRLNEQVGAGSGIRTGSDGTVEISSDDGTRLLVRPDSALQISTARKTFAYYLHQISLRAGRVISHVRTATGRAARYEIRTPSAIAAARGTDYRVSLDTLNDMRAEVLEGSVAVSAQGRTVAVNEGEGTIAKMNEPPLPPQRLLPPPSPREFMSNFREMPLKFKFSDVPGAVAYRALLTRDRDGRDVVREQRIEPAQSFEIVGVADGTYYLRSLSIAVNGLEGPLSEPEGLKVRVNPLPPLVVTPLIAARLHTPTVELTWLKVRDAVCYHVQIAEDGEFRKIVYDKNDLQGTTGTTPPLKTQSYWFRLSSIAEDGYEGGWSAAREFVVVLPPPVPPVERPESSGTGISLHWGDLGTGITYQAQMARDEQFLDIIADRKVAVPKVELTKPAEAGTYYVRIRAIDREGYAGSFSTPQSFTIDSLLFPVLGVLGGIWGVGLILFLAL